MKRRWKRRVVEVRAAFAEKAFWDGRAAGQRLTQPHHYFRPEDIVREPRITSAGALDSDACLIDGRPACAMEVAALRFAKPRSPGKTQALLEARLAFVAQNPHAIIHFTGLSG